MFTRQLIWKEARAVRPLVIAITVGSIGLILLTAAVASLLGERPQNVAVAIWILMPNLVALGAPALLVGSEEESGTLNWLRSLPIRWQQIVDTKFFVSLAAVAVAWLIASLIFVLSGSQNWGTFSREMTSPRGVTQLVFFTFFLLSTGFATAYLFRSPVTALVVLVPVITIIDLSVVALADWAMYGIVGLPRKQSLTSTQWWWLLGICSSTTVILWLIQRLLGRARLRRRDDTAISRLKFATRSPSPSSTAYLPPVWTGSERPSPLHAMLWQQSCQAFWPSVLLSGLSLLFLIAHYTHSHYGDPWHPLASFAPLVLGLCSCWLGVLSFYGDNVRGRCQFFSDRGISPTQAWWTRLAVPGVFLAMLLIASVILIFVTDYEGYRWVMPMLMLIGFAFGQLVGQWVRRPALSLFGAPAYASISCLLLIMFADLYANYVYALVLVTPVLILTTWRLATRWLDGRIDLSYHWRVLAYTALALLLPVITVVGHRLATTPSLMPEWRSRMLATGGPLSVDQPSTYARLGWGEEKDLSNDPAELRDYVEELRGSLGDNQLVTDRALYANLDQLPPEYIEEADPELIAELRLLSIEALLKRSSAMRRDLIEGTASWPAFNQAIIDERVAIGALNSLRQRRGFDEELRRLVAMIPADELRRKSAEIALIRGWQHYQDQDWEYEVRGIQRYGKGFMGNSVAPRSNRISFEQRRADRYVDLATRRTLEFLREEESSLSYDELTKLWWQVFDPTAPAWNVYYYDVPAVSTATDVAIDELRTQVAKASR